MPPAKADYGPISRELRKLLESGETPEELAGHLGRLIDVISGDLRWKQAQQKDPHLRLKPGTRRKRP